MEAVQGDSARGRASAPNRHVYTVIALTDDLFPILSPSVSAAAITSGPPTSYSTVDMVPSLGTGISGAPSGRPPSVHSIFAPAHFTRDTRAPAALICLPITPRKSASSRLAPTRLTERKR